MGDLAVIGIAALVLLIGVYLLFDRVIHASSKRRSAAVALAAAASQEAASGPADGASRLEIQLRDANNALFLVLMECCTMIVEAGDGSDAVKNNAFVYAKNLRQSGRSTMPNKEIADHGYQLAAELGSPTDPAAAAIRRVLSQLAFAERWGSQLG